MPRLPFLKNLNDMNQVLSIVSGIITAAIFYFIGKGIGQWLIEILKDSGGMITATEMIECKYVIPVVVAILAGWIAYYLVKEKN
jgi:hypothetical protein